MNIASAQLAKIQISLQKLNVIELNKMLELASDFLHKANKLVTRLDAQLTSTITKVDSHEAQVKSIQLIEEKLEKFASIINKKIEIVVEKFSHYEYAKPFTLQYKQNQQLIEKTMYLLQKNYLVTYQQFMQHLADKLIINVQDFTTSDDPSPKFADFSYQHINLAYHDVNLQNAYEVLQLAPNASLAQVKKAYIKLSKMYHPDYNHDAQAQQIMQAINQAYALLKTNLS